MVYDNMVFFGCRDANLYALDASTGNLIWRKFNNFSWINNTPVVKDSIVYYGTSDTHKLIGLNAYNGDSLFTLNLNSYIFSSPVIAGDYLYIGDFSGTVFCVDTELKKIAWKFRTQGSLENRDNLLLPSGESNSQGGAVFFKSGPTFANNMKFMEALYNLGAVLSTPLVDNGVVYFGSSDGNIYALH
jgi:outer membrane protein assembly factor BamB